MTENFQALIDAARAGVEPFQVEDINGVAFIHPATGNVINLEKMLERPLRKRGITQVFDALGFNFALAPHLGFATVYVDRDVNKPAIVAILNGHTKDAAGWHDHRVALLLRQTPQWVKWRGIDGKLLSQTDFAEFIEDNGSDIADPDGATLLEIAQHLQVSRATSFRSAVRLSSGSFQFLHSEDQTAKVGAGEVAIPETITLGIAPFQASAPFRIPARLRYRLNDGKLTLGIRLQRLEDVVSQAVDDVVAGIDTGDNVVLIEGVAPDPVSA